jgi:hypothetical protein
MEKRGEFDVERLRFDPPRVQVRRGQEEDDAGEQGVHRLSWSRVAIVLDNLCVMCKNKNIGVKKVIYLSIF